MNKKILLILFFVFIFINIINSSTIEKFISSKKKKISVVLMLKNNEFYTKKLDELFSELEKDNSYEFEYFIYENNSSDKTKKNIVKFLNNRKGRLILENMKKPKGFGSIISKERGIFMAKLRNKLKYHHENLDSDYTLLLDSDIVFNKKMLDKMFNHISEKNVMITPYTVCLKAFLNYPTPHYYDTLALISKNGLSFKDTINTCLFPECSRCIIHRNNYKVNIDKKDMINDNVSEVQCAFAGFVLMKTDIYNKVKWSGTICEHHSFCDEVRKFGNILLIKDVKPVVMNKSNEAEYKLSKEIINKLNK